MRPRRRSATSSRGSCTAVAWYQAGRGNRVGCERQLEKAARRLGPYGPAHRGVDVVGLLAQVEAARGAFPNLAPVRVRRELSPPADRQSEG